MKYYRLQNGNFEEKGTFRLEKGVVKMSDNLTKSFGTVSFFEVEAKPEDGIKFLKILAISLYNSSLERFSMEASDTWAPKKIDAVVIREWVTEIVAERGKK